MQATRQCVYVRGGEVSHRQELWSEPAVLAGAQQFAFVCLLPVEMGAIMIGFRGRKDGAHGTP
jgi:hypothetical protein